MPRVGLGTPRTRINSAIVVATIVTAIAVPRYYFFPALFGYAVWGLLKSVVIGFLDRLPERDPLLEVDEDEEEEESEDDEEPGRSTTAASDPATAPAGATDLSGAGGGPRRRTTTARRTQLEPVHHRDPRDPSPRTAGPAGKGHPARPGLPGFAGVGDVRAGKLLVVELEAGSPDEAAARATRMCEKLLANPVTEDFAIEVGRDAAQPEAAT